MRHSETAKRVAKRRWGRQVAGFLLLSLAWGLVSACGNGQENIRARSVPSIGNIRLAVQPVLGGPTGDSADIAKVWVRVRSVEDDVPHREFELHRMAEFHGWEANIDQQIRAGDYEFTAFAFADLEADPLVDEPLYASVRVPVTIHDSRETSVLILLGPRSVLPQSEVPYIESVVIEPSNADPRDEVIFTVRAGGGSGRLSASGWSPSWASAGYSGWFAQGAYFDGKGAAVIRGETSPVPGFWAVALRVQDTAGNMADVGVTLGNGKRNPFYPLTWNLSPAVSLSGEVHHSEQGVGARIQAKFSDDRSSALHYSWSSPCELLFMTDEGGGAAGTLLQSERGRAGSMPFFVLVEEGKESCPLTLRVTDEEGASSEALLRVDTTGQRVDVADDDWSQG